MTNTNTYVKAHSYGGLDWHDIIAWSDFLQEDEKKKLQHKQ